MTLINCSERLLRNPAIVAIDFLQNLFTCFFFFPAKMISMLPKTDSKTATLCNSLFKESNIWLRNKTMASEKKKKYSGNSNGYYANSTCTTLRNGFVSKATKEEQNYPIAFTIMIYKDIEQVYRLLRAIYRPSNYYCIHVDLKVCYVSFLIAIYIPSNYHCSHVGLEVLYAMFNF